jgi:hypothetical protein
VLTAHVSHGSKKQGHLTRGSTASVIPTSFYRRSGLSSTCRLTGAPTRSLRNGKDRRMNPPSESTTKYGSEWPVISTIVFAVSLPFCSSSTCSLTGDCGSSYCMHAAWPCLSRRGLHMLPCTRARLTSMILHPIHEVRVCTIFSSTKWSHKHPLL